MKACNLRRRLRLVSVFIQMLLATFILNALKAQQVPLQSHYASELFSINPAAAGLVNHTWSTSLQYRKQWVGFEGSPVLQTFTSHTPFENNKSGIGLKLENHSAGVVAQTGIYLAYAYHIPLGNIKNRLSLGLQGGYIQYRLNGSKLNTTEADDPAIPKVEINSWVPDFSPGIHFSTPNGYAGITVPHLYSAQLDFKEISQTLNAKLEQHYYFVCGYQYEIARDYLLRSSALLKGVAKAPLQFELGVDLFMMNTFWIGTAFRSGDAIIALLGYEWDKKLSVAYSFDFTTSQLTKYNSGSHELTLKYNFIRVKNVIR